MSVYLVDYENVNVGGIKGIEKLNSKDTVYIFYTQKANNISFETHKIIMSSKAQVKYFDVHNGGKNALDFQLALFTGFLIGSGIDSDIYIISNDKGFDFNLGFYESYLHSDTIDIIRTPSISGTFINNPAGKRKKRSKEDIKMSEANKNESSYDRICRLLDGICSSCDMINISATFMESKSKNDFYVKLVDKFGQEKGLEIYNALKRDYASLKKSA